MFEMDFTIIAIGVLVFLSVGCLAYAVFRVLFGGGDAGSRLRELVGLQPKAKEGSFLGEAALSALPKLGAPLMPGDEQGRAHLQERLHHAGLYSRKAPGRFLGVKMALLIVAGVLALTIGLAGWLSFYPALIVGALLVGLAIFGPDLWLAERKRQRQKLLRRAMPDLLDMLSICLDAGLGLQESLRRVGEELRLTHPIMGQEMSIVQQEMMLGLSAGEAMHKMANRCGLAEARSLAAALTQGERYGLGLARTLRIHAETYRQARHQRAEELAQKAAVKIIFPTLLFIFPAIFIVVMGPAIYGLMESFKRFE